MRLLVGSGAVDALGNGMANVALAFGVLRIGGAADLGYTFLAREIPMVVVTLAVSASPAVRNLRPAPSNLAVPAD